MKITAVRLGQIAVPLRVPFKTALRTVDSVRDVVVEIDTDTGEKGFGEAPPTGVITGDTTGAIIGAIQDHITGKLIGRDVDEFEDVIQEVQKAVVHNTSAKAAVDMALYDLYGQLYHIGIQAAGRRPQDDCHGHYDQCEPAGTDGGGRRGRGKARL